MQLEAARKLSRDLMKEHGLDLHVWDVEFVKDMSTDKGCLGQCFRLSRRIKVDLAFVQRNDEATMRELMLHEIAHALVPFAEDQELEAHGPAFQRVALRVGAWPEACLPNAIRK